MAAIGVDRDHARGQRAAEIVRARGGSAMEAALAAIEATFSPAIRYSSFKRRVAGMIWRGAAHPEARSRYQRLAERYAQANLDTAIVLVERLYRAEIDARDAAVRMWGRCSRPRLALMQLQELRLVRRRGRRPAPRPHPASVAPLLARHRAENFVGPGVEAAE